MEEENDYDALLEYRKEILETKSKSDDDFEKLTFILENVKRFLYNEIYFPIKFGNTKYVQDFYID